MQPGQTQFGGNVSLRDPSSQQTVNTKVFGTVSFSVNADPTQYAGHVQQALIAAANQVLSQKLATNQLAIPTLSHSAQALAPEIMQAAQGQLQGIQLGQLQLQIQPEMPAAPAGPPMVMPPSPMESMQNAYANKAKEALDPSNYEVQAKLNIGGFKVGMSSEDGLDTDGLKKQAVDKAKSKLIGCVITAVVLFIVLCLLLGLAWYIYAKIKSEAAVSASPTAVEAPPASALKDAEWDGKSAFTCGSGDKLRINGVTAKLTTGTAITAGSSCVLLIENSTIEAPTGVSVLGNANVTIKGGSVKGTAAALKALGNCKITVEGAKIDGKVTKLGKAVIEGATP